MPKRVQGGIEGGSAPEGGLESLVEPLRALLRRADELPETGLEPEEVAVLQAVLEALREVPRVLREGMETAFQLGREHGKKEELLARLEEEIAVEAARLGREAWGQAPPGAEDESDF